MRAILTFHNIDASGSPISITRQEFASLVDGILQSGHSVVPLRQLLDEPQTPRRIALTFDDGFASTHESAFPVLRRVGLTATLFLTTDHVGGDSRWASLPAGAPVFPMLSWSQVDDLYRAGWSIEAHTATHPDLRLLPPDRIEAEFARADAAIGERLGKAPDVLAYPYGYRNQRVEDIAARRYRFAVTTRLRELPRRVAARYRIPRLDAYYLRHRQFHGNFGGPGLRAYLRLRGGLRGLRRS